MMTADEIRELMLKSVSRNGGHLASSLGAVELAMALAKTFDPAKDRVVWDVGHQAYAWKILTGRAERFGTIRTFGGLSGFPNPRESPCDAAVAGHAGVALSVALGLAAARDRKGTDEHVVAVVGDASIVNGTSFEALNNCAAATRKVIVVLNDNEMAISKPAGSFARFLGRLIADARYNRVKNAAKRAGHALRLSFLHGAVHWVKSRIKSIFLGNAYFEQFGLRYIGPVDGHDLGALESALSVARDGEQSAIVHVVTKKGCGFRPAEKDPTKWHGVGPFAYPPRDGGGDAAATAGGAIGWSEAFGGALAAGAREDARIVALTAGMKDGTGLAPFAAEFPDRFLDVGIAEGHMVAYAAGLAGGGMRPVVAVYSTFLQRAIDQVMHDVCISKLPVVFGVDRAGVVGADGMTHQGVFDLSLLRALPNLVICQPCDGDDLAALLREALHRDGPTVIRYPRGKCPAAPEPAVEAGALSRVSSAAGKASVAIWATGDWYGKARRVAARLGDAVAVQARYLKPFDAALLASQRAAGCRIVSLENASVIGGLGEAIGADVRFGWPDEFVAHGSQSELEKLYGLDEDAIVARLAGTENREEKK